MDFTGKTVLVMGLGRFGGGTDAAGFAAKRADKVIVTDTAAAEKLSASVKSLEKFANIEFVLGRHNKEDFASADIVIVNPAVAQSNKFVKIAEKAGAVITSQIEIFFELCRGKIVGVTGSNGKSTTTALSAHLIKNAKDQPGRVFLGGNIGKSPLLEIVEQIGQKDIAVLELSSFQLEQLGGTQKSPHISCVTNISPNHLDRHKTMANYIDAKENIFRFQSKDDFTVLNSADAQCRKWFDKYKDNRNCRLFDPAKLDERLVSRFKLPGKANAQNLAAAVTICQCLGLETEQIARPAGTFSPLSHRLELTAEKNGVRWYNDSISTTPESTIVAIEAFDEPKILIAGGYDKGLSFDKLAAAAAKKVKKIILIGTTAQKIAREIEKADIQRKPDIILGRSMESAVKIADQNAEPGDVVLLSPACASYDMFENFEQRGNEFCALAKAL